MLSPYAPTMTSLVSKNMLKRAYIGNRMIFQIQRQPTTFAPESVQDIQMKGPQWDS